MSMEKKQSSVEWLVDQILTPNDMDMAFFKRISSSELKKLIQQANEMHEQDIIDAVEEFAPEWIDAKQYYTEKFKQK